MIDFLYKFIKYYIMSMGIVFATYSTILSVYADIEPRHTGTYIFDMLYNLTWMEFLPFALWSLLVTVIILLHDHFVHPLRR